MSLLHRSHVGILVLASVFTACNNGKDTVGPQRAALRTGEPLFTQSTSTSKLLGRATFLDPKDQNFNVKRIEDDWHFDLKAKPAVDIAVQTIDFPAGTQSGWHSHPGPVFIQVVTGTLAFYESDDPTCTPIIKSKGEGYLDAGEHAHIARNESGALAQTVVTYFAPPGTTLRIDQPSPGNCPF